MPVGDHQAIVDLIEPRDPAQRHGANQLGQQVIEHGLHAVGSVERKSPDHRARNQHGTGAERNRLDERTRVRLASPSGA